MIITSIFVTWVIGGITMEQKKTNPLRKGIALALALALIAGTFFMLPTKAADTSALGQLIDGFTAAGAGVVFNLNASSRFFLTVEPTGELLQTVQLVQRQLATDPLRQASGHRLGQRQHGSRRRHPDQAGGQGRSS